MTDTEAYELGAAAGRASETCSEDTRTLADLRECLEDIDRGVGEHIEHLSPFPYVEGDHENDDYRCAWDTGFHHGAHDVLWHLIDKKTNYGYGEDEPEGSDTPPGRPEVMMSLRQSSMLRELSRAEIIIGIDEVTQNEFVVFGWDIIHGIAASGTSRFVYVVRVPLLQDTVELEALIAATCLVKGHHEYIPSQEEAA